MILPGQTKPLAKLLTRYRDEVLLTEDNVGISEGYSANSILPDHMERSPDLSSACATPAHPCSLPLSIELPASQSLEPLSEEELAILFASCMSPSRSELDSAKGQAMLDSPMSLSPSSSEQDLTWLAQLQEAEWLVDTVGDLAYTQSSQLSFTDEKSLAPAAPTAPAAAATNVVATIVAAENVGLFDADSLPVAIADAAIAVGHPSFDKDLEYFGEFYPDEDDAMADHPGVIVAQPLQLRPIPLHLPPCNHEPWVHGQPGCGLPASPLQDAVATPYPPMGTWSPGASFYDEEAMDAWLSQFMLEQECAALSSSNHLHPHHLPHYGEGNPMDRQPGPARGFEETKDEDDSHGPSSSSSSSSSSSGVGSLGCHHGYEIAEAKYVDFDSRVRSAVAAQPSRLTLDGDDVPVRIPLPPAPVAVSSLLGGLPTAHSPSPSLGYRGVRAQHWRERRARARSGSCGSKAKHAFVAQATTAHPPLLPRPIVSPSSALLPVVDNPPSTAVVVGSKRAASMRRSRTNGKFTKCKISWVSISELEKQHHDTMR